MQIPENCDFAYIISRETWYWDARKRPDVIIQAAADDGGVAWELVVEEYDLNDRAAIRVGVFDDAFEAFSQVPEFFAALAAESPDTLPGVVSILDRLGAVDRTQRQRGTVRA